MEWSLVGLLCIITLLLVLLQLATMVEKILPKIPCVCCDDFFFETQTYTCLLI